jgi:hypothetical protein
MDIEEKKIEKAGEVNEFNHFLAFLSNLFEFL